MRSLLCWSFLAAALAVGVSAQPVPRVETVVVRLDYLTHEPEVFYTSSAPYRGVLPAPGDRVAGALHLAFRPDPDWEGTSGVFPPGDTEVRHALTGERLFVATTAWRPAGRFVFPTGGSRAPGAPGTPVQAAALEFVLRFDDDVDFARLAWDAVARTAPARALARRGPVDVVVFDHDYRVRDAETAEWIVVMTVRPDAPRDLSVVEVVWPSRVVTAGQPFRSEVRVHNFDDDPARGTLVLEIDGVFVGDAEVALGAMESAVVTLPTQTLRAPGALRAWIDSDGARDANPSNDDATVETAVTSAPVFRAFPPVPGAARRAYRSVPLDVDGDGDLDELDLRYEPVLWIREADGTFSDATDRLGGLVGPYPRGAVAVDLTGDSRTDLLVTFWEKPPLMLRAEADGAYTDVTAPSGLGGFSVSGAGHAADLDGDGDQDVVLRDGRRPTVFLNDGAGAFTRGAELPGRGRAQGMTLADLDGDGDLDLAVPNWYAPASVYENRGDASFVARDGPWPRGANRHVAPFDLDADGDLDLLFCRTNRDSVVVLRNDGGFAFTEVDVPALRRSAFHASAADVTGDGRDDLLLDSLHNATLLIRTDEGFADRTDLLVWPAGGPRPSGIGTAPYSRFIDLDGDGDLDIHSRSVYFENQGTPPEAARRSARPLPGPD